MITPDQIVTITLNNFYDMSGLGKTTTWEMMSDGRLEYVKIGKRRLIVMDSYRRLIAKQLAEGVPEDRSTATAIRARMEKRALAESIDLDELGLGAA